MATTVVVLMAQHAWSAKGTFHRSMLRPPAMRCTVLGDPLAAPPLTTKPAPGPMTTAARNNSRREAMPAVLIGELVATSTVAHDSW
jgi:hypothetical protein